MSAKTALITGISGQDGSYLAEFLLEKGYAVHGLVRRSAMDNEGYGLANLSGCLDRIRLHVAGLDNPHALHRVIDSVRPDECYHLAAPSFVSHSFDDELSSFNHGFNSMHALLSGLKERAPDCRFYFAGSSEMFGSAEAYPQSESTPLRPRSIYGIAKVACHHLAVNYRDRFGMFCSTGFLYNHESPRRRFEFVTRKISSGVAKIKLGLEKRLVLGNLDAERDWGYAPEYVEAMWRMLQQPKPSDFVIATGRPRTVREFLETAFRCVELDPTGRVETDSRFYRSTEAVPLVGDSAKARRTLGWEPRRPFDEIVREMVEHDLRLYSRA